MNILNTTTNDTTPVSMVSLQTSIRNNVITVVLCITINYFNSILLHTFKKYQVLNTNPRYILYVNLVINDMFLLIMFTLLQGLNAIFTAYNVFVCMVLQVIAITVTLNNPLTLAAMAVECYIAVCFPLRHTQICTVQKTYVVIILISVINAFSIILDVFIALATEPIEFFSSRVTCIRENVFRKSIFTVKRDVSNTVFFVIVWLTLFYTYFRILFTARAAATGAKKARNTVVLHGFQLLLCMLNYAFNLIIQGLTNMFPKDAMAIRFYITIVISVMPRLISPLIYAVRDKTFRKYLKRYFSKSTSETNQQKKLANKLNFM